MTLSRTGNYYHVDKLSPGRNSRLEIGDAREASFFPHFKSMHWDDECSLDIRLVDARYDLGITTERTGQRIEWARGNRIARFYEVAGFEDGGLEFEIELLTKPATPDIALTVNSKAFNLFHQPALTAEEIALGASRPDNIINSYAVCHSTRAGNIVGGKAYRAGKAAHIPRSFAVDLLGNRVWCTQNISAGTWTITLPTDFWNSATYPVVVDPTFGYTSIGGSTNTATQDLFQGFAYGQTDASGGTVSSIKVAVDSPSGGNVRMAIYTNAGANPPPDATAKPDNLVANTDTGSIAVTQTTKPTLDAEWTSGAVTGTVGASTYYWLCINKSSSAINSYYDSASANSRWYVGDSYANFPNSPAPGGLTGSAVIFSIYATYAAAGGTTWPGYYGGGFF